MLWNLRRDSVVQLSGMLALAILCCCIGSRAQQPLQPQTAASSEKGGAAKAAGHLTQPQPSGQSSVTVACQCPVELLVTDPRGKRTGGDPIAHKSYDEIDAAYYESAGIEDDETGAAESDPAKTFFVANPLPGWYRLSIMGTGGGTYTCQFLSTDLKGGSAQAQLEKIPIVEGEVHKFVFEFDGQPGTHLRLQGGFSQHAANEPSPLSYATPLAASVHASSRGHGFSFLIFYDRAVDASTFSAELNGKTATSLFHPQPGGWELVQIPLAETTNKLQLSVNGGSGSTANTVDRFEILP